MTVDGDNKVHRIEQGDDTAEGVVHGAASGGKLLGRMQAARLLGVSKSTLRRMEGDSLDPVVGPRNVRLFHEEQVHSLLVTRRAEVSGGRADGALAADTFELFDAGVHPVDAVKRLRVDPDLIELLHQRWSRLRSMLMLTEEGVLTLHRMLGEDESLAPPQSESELLAFARKWVHEVSVRQCDQCRVNGAAFCRGCAKAWGLRATRNEIASRRSRRL